MITDWYQRLVAFGRGDGLRAQLIRGALGVGSLRLLSFPLTFTASILLARGLGPDRYGQYAFVMAVITLLTIPVGPGLGQLITREVAKYHYEAEWRLFRGLLQRAHQWVLLVSVVAVAILTMLAVQNATWAVDDRWTLLLIAMLMLPLAGLNAVRASTLRGLRNVVYAQIPDLLAQPGLHMVFAGSLFWVGLLNPATALASQIAATGSALLLGAWFLSRFRPANISQAQPDYFDRKWGRALLPFVMLAAVGPLNTQLGILALGWIGTDAEVGALRVAQRGALLVTLSLTIVNMVIGPHVARARSDNDQVRLRQLSRQSARAALLMATPIALPLVVFGGPIVSFVFGGAYVDTVTIPLAILGVAQLVNVAFGSVGLFLLMGGYERDAVVGQIVGLGVNAVAAALLIPPYGVEGAALAAAIGTVLWNGVLALRFFQRFGFRPSAF